MASRTLHCRHSLCRRPGARLWRYDVPVLGAEFNAELERGRATAAGHPAGLEPFTELRDDRKLRKNAEKHSQN